MSLRVFFEKVGGMGGVKERGEKEKRARGMFLAKVGQERFAAFVACFAV